MKAFHLSRASGQLGRRKSLRLATESYTPVWQPQWAALPLPVCGGERKRPNPNRAKRWLGRAENTLKPIIQRPGHTQKNTGVGETSSDYFLFSELCISKQPIFLNGKAYHVCVCLWVYMYVCV